MFSNIAATKRRFSKKGHPTSLNMTKIKEYIFLAIFLQNCKSLIAFCLNYKSSVLLASSKL